jgi:hypothetical protein
MIALKVKTPDSVGHSAMPTQLHVDEWERASDEAGQMRVVDFATAARRRPPAPIRGANFVRREVSGLAATRSVSRMPLLSQRRVLASA